MNEPYTLRYKQSEETLQKLNRDIGLTGFKRAIEDIVSVSGKDEVIDMVAACWSGKEIVNPMSPREEFRKEYKAISELAEDATIKHRDYYIGKKNGMVEALEFFAKERAEVKDWLKDGEKDE